MVATILKLGQGSVGVLHIGWLTKDRGRVVENFMRLICHRESDRTGCGIHSEAMMQHKHHVHYVWPSVMSLESFSIETLSVDSAHSRLSTGAARTT
eukprot:1034191-Amphidinium_carterae.1